VQNKDVEISLQDGFGHGFFYFELPPSPKTEAKENLDITISVLNYYISTYLKMKNVKM
jgi:hypothetical protein